MDAASYTYVRVNTGAKEIWAAAGQFPVAVGDRVVVPLEMPMENFHSQSLNRDFPLIYFASAITKEGELPPAGMPPAHPPVGGATAASTAEPVEPAPGGLTVAGVWSDRTGLAGKAVTVRGRVVKYNGGILGRNWLHLQDGTGRSEDGSNDLAVTCTTEARVGDVITVTGTVAADKDFGAGYAYKVIVLDATVTPK